MLKRINDCLEGKEGSYIFPFFWIHGEEHKELEEEIDAIHRSGIREFCVESRPHEGFCKESWWEDIGFILEEAKKRDMKVWILDDKHFPTGYVNGAIRDKYPHLKKKSVRIEWLDVIGPEKEACILSDWYDPSTESILSISAFKRTGQGEEVEGASGVLLNDNLHDGLVFWDIPQGHWRIYFIINTQRGPKHFEHYIDMLDADSCKLMIKEIYEPHYQKFSKYFSNTFKGFFSDEPCFANNIGSYYDKLGIPSLILPWREDMIDLLSKEIDTSDKAELFLPALWHPVKGAISSMRYAYMDIVSKLYRDNFSKMIGAWCKDHGVLYTGHVIEDMNTHMRLGYGAGHYFRAMEGQDIAGIDVVLHQIKPGQTDSCHKTPTSGGRADAGFFIDTLAKLGQSAAHLDPKKEGRAMCELYGAYGYSEGLPTMKYLTDLMLVKGINHFVPHAFTPKEDDPDCPLHFYNKGKNPQFKAFRYLMEYLQRACHILSGGKHIANAAVFYNAEGEWCGLDNRLFQDIATVLRKKQIDFDFLPSDLFFSSEALVCDKKLLVGNESFDALIISYSQAFPKKILKALSSYAKEGLPIIFTEALPSFTHEFYEDERELMDLCKDFLVMPLDEIPQYFKLKGFLDIELVDAFPDLHFYHIEQEDSHVYFFFNASLERKIDSFVDLKRQAYAYEYDLWDNKILKLHMDTTKIRLTLDEGQACLIYLSDKEIEAPLKEPLKAFKDLPNIAFNLSLKDLEGIRDFGKIDSSRLRNLAREMPSFVGSLFYEGDIESRKLDYLDLGQVGEVASLWVNNQYCGTRISKPYIFDVSKAFIEGRNRIKIEVISNLAYGFKDPFAKFAQLPATGLLGPLRGS